MKVFLCTLLCVSLTTISQPCLAQESELVPVDPSAAGVEDAENTEAIKLTPENIKASIQEAMFYLEGKEGTPGNGPQFSDYVVFCGIPVVNDFPEYADILEEYKIWITENDRYISQLPYQSICHVMPLDMIGEKDTAVEIFSELAPMADDGKWDNIPYHIGWYLYGCIVAEDEELLNSTWLETTDRVENHPHRLQYFTAYCLWKAYEKTKEDRYHELFLMAAENVNAFLDEYLKMAETDGHAGLALTVFCQAYAETKDEGYRDYARQLAEALLSSQEENGSWNDKTAYTIMPAEGLAAYLRFCQ